MFTKNHALLTFEVSRHIDADALVQGKYWDSESQKGCFIGCLAPSHGDKPEELSELYGLPVDLVRLCECIFEWLPLEEAKAFFAAIPEAIGRDGKDLSRVVWQFLAAELRALPPVPEEAQPVINVVIAGIDLLASGQPWSKEEAIAAAIAADTAYYTGRINVCAARAAYCAACAAYCAAYAARAPRFLRGQYASQASLAIREAHIDRAVAIARQRDTLLNLIRKS